jgi:hypothetical protein
MPPRLREIALRGVQGPACHAGDAFGAGVPLRGPPGCSRRSREITNALDRCHQEVSASRQDPILCSGGVISFGRNG